MQQRSVVARFQTQRDGLGISDSVVPEGLSGQRRLAPLGPGTLHAPGRQVELAGREHLDAEGA